MSRLMAGSRTAGRPLVWIVVFAVVAGLPWLGLGASDLRTVILIAILALTVSGLNLSLGYAGELALGQVAVYAAGAYTGGYIAISVVNDVVVALLAAAVAALVVGIVTGIPGLRLGHWTLAITSFFMVLLIPSIVNLFGDRLGRYDGLQGIPIAKIFGHELGTNGFYLLVVVVAGLWFALLRNLVMSNFGASLLVLKESPVLAGAVGTSPYVTKLKAYAIGAVPAGLAGCLAAYQDSYISPVSFGLDLTIVILAASILGGAMTVYGAIVGAAIMQYGPLESTVFEKYATIAYGAFLLLGGLLLRNGLAGVATSVVGYLRLHVRHHEQESAQDTAGALIGLPDVEPTVLRLTGLTKAFGGNAAVDDVSFVALPGQITALIGPNGSGKTTTMNLISGYYRADRGVVTLNDRDVTGLPPHKVSRSGVGRTFQTPLVPRGLTVRQVLTTGRLGTSPVSLVATALRLPVHRRTVAQDHEVGDRILGALRLLDRADADASSLALGTRRMLELGRAVAGGSSLILLDEVASGLDEADIAELVRILEQVKRAGATILLVEHNFALVRAIADHVVVLGEGRVLAAGSIGEIEVDPAVLKGYLGDGVEVTGTRSSEHASSRAPTDITPDRPTGTLGRPG